MFQSESGISPQGDTKAATKNADAKGTHPMYAHLPSPANQSNTTLNMKPNTSKVELKAFNLVSEKVESTYDRKLLPSLDGTQDLLQRATLRHLTRDSCLSLTRKIFKYKCVKPEDIPLPDYIVDEHMRKNDGSGKDLDEEEVKSLFISSSPKKGTVRVDRSFRNATIASCRQSFAKEKEALDADGVSWRFDPKYKYKRKKISAERQVPQWEDEPVRQILFCIESLTFGAGDFEPMFCSATVYDFKTGERVTEAFKFAFNDPEELKRIMREGISSTDHDRQKKWAIVSVSEVHSEMYLVVKIERILQGESSQQDSLYIKGNSMRKGHRDAIKKKTQATIRRLHEFYQPFCWGMVQLFDEDDELIPVGNWEMDQLYFQLEAVPNDQFIKHAKEILADSKKTGLKKVQGGKLKMSVIELGEKLPARRLGPMGVPMATPKDVLDLSMGGKNQPPVIEIQEFHGMEQMSVPYTRFVNNLYVYVTHANFQKYRNLAVKIEVRQQDGKLQASGAPWIYSRNGKKVHEVYLPVNYHNKRPHFYTEVKIALPLVITRQAHLFFTFYNVKCKKSTLKSKMKDLIGYSMLSLYSARALLPDGEHAVRVAEKLPKNYLIPFEQFRADGTIKFRFSGEKHFYVTTRTISNMFPTDPEINSFLNSWPTKKELERLLEKPGNFLSVLLTKALSYLQKADRRTLILFLPGLLDFMCEVMCTWRAEARPFAFEGLLIISSRVNEHFDLREGQVAEHLLSYVQHSYQNIPELPLFNPLATCLLAALCENKTSNIEKLRLHRCCGFIFELIFKSVVEEHMRGKSRKTIQSMEIFSQIIEGIVDSCAELVYNHRSLGRFLLKNIVHSLSRFLVKLFDVLNPLRVLEFIEQFMEEKDLQTDAVRVDMRADFLHIILDYDYIVEIMNPSALDQALSKAVEDRETDIFSLILDLNPIARVVVDFLQYCVFNDRTEHDKAITVFQDMITRIDFDQRFQDPDTKSQIATMFTPFLRMLAENIRMLKRLADLKAAESSAKANTSMRRLRNLLTCGAWVLKGFDPRARDLWWKNEDPNELADFVSLLELMTRIFEYPSLQRRKVEEKFDCILSAATAAHLGGEKAPGTVSDLKNNLESLYTTTKGRDRKLTLRERRAQINKRTQTWRRTAGATLTSSSREYLRSILRLESAMAVCVSRSVVAAVIDLLDYAQELIDPSNNDNVNLCGGLLRLLTTLLRSEQTTEIWIVVLHAVHLFIRQYGRAIFLVVPFDPLIQSLATVLLLLCKHRPDKLCCGAVSAAYALVKANFRAKNDLDQIQIALTVGMSKLVSTVSDESPEEETRVRRILYLFPKYHSKSSEGKGQGFSSMVQVLTKRMATILQDSIEIRRQAGLSIYDKTTLQHLLLSIANAYMHIPEIQVQHLERLAEFQKDHEHFAEAGNCYQLMAQIYDTKLSSLPAGDGENTPDTSGSTSVERTETCYRLACEMFDKARLYESCDQTYKALIPILERQNKFTDLCKAYAHLSGVFHELASAVDKNDRLLGTYYRIGFYGSAFGPERDGKEFIYKWPLVTRLVEVVGEMRSLYSKLLQGDIVVYKDSSVIDPKKIDPKTNLLQITYVVPHFSPEDAKMRTDFISRTTNLQEFIFTTPFTKDSGGRAHAKHCTSQYKRKTILRVSNPFPSLKTAQEVVSRSELILGPLQNAIEDIDERAHRLEVALAKIPISIKNLSGILHGVVIAQVHGGPVEICHAFLKDSKEEYPKPKLASLRAALRRLLQACQRGLDVVAGDSKNGDQLIKHLNNGFDTICTEMRPYIQREKRKSKAGSQSEAKSVRFAVS